MPARATLTGDAEAALRALLPRGVAVAAADPRAPAPPLLPEEAPAVAAVAPARRREFAAGRAAARAAMAALGLPPRPLPQAPDRAPLWPPGVIGSLTHSATLALAAVARRGELLGLGIDAEPDAPLAPGLWDAVLGPEERRALSLRPDPGRAALLAFAAKEATFKAQYPLTGKLFGFEALRIAFGAGAGRFRARLEAAAGMFPAGHIFEGRWARAAGHLIVAVTVPR